jgi:hypothetical protein
MYEKYNDIKIRNGVIINLDESDGSESDAE